MSNYLISAAMLGLLLTLSACGGSDDNPSEATQLNEPETRAALALDSKQCSVITSGTPVANGHREVVVSAGTFTMGSDRHYREERPQREVYVPEFTIDVHEVTNRQFAEFVRQTGYITTAEKIPLAVDNPGIPAQFLVAGSAVFVSPADGKAGHWTDWWQFVPGTSWKNPEGPGSDIAGRENHPVVHVSYLDAKAYAQWAGRSLPVEAQWERAAKALGDSLAANTWQGVFPLQNRSLDGFAGTAPVGCFAANDLGIHDMIGNVWEWVDDPYSEAGPAAQERVRTGSAAKAIKRVVKGGSYLCASNYCRRDRPQARQSQEENFGSAHIGFRTVSQLPVD